MYSVKTFGTKWINFFTSRSISDKEVIMAKCRYCGMEFSNERTLLSLPCSRHPLGSCKGKHALLEGDTGKTYICVYCGQEITSLRTLTAMPCPRHPRGSCKGKHVPYEGTLKSEYKCKYCGRGFRSIRTMVAAPCSRHPDGSCKGGNHSPAR